MARRSGSLDYKLKGPLPSKHGDIGIYKFNQHSIIDPRSTDYNNQFATFNAQMKAANPNQPDNGSKKQIIYSHKGQKPTKNASQGQKS